MFHINALLTHSFIEVFLRLGQGTFWGLLNRGGRVNSADIGLIADQGNPVRQLGL